MPKSRSAAGIEQIWLVSVELDRTAVSANGHLAFPRTLNWAMCGRLKTGSEAVLVGLTDLPESTCPVCRRMLTEWVDLGVKFS